jgi:hypothetical protein
MPSFIPEIPRFDNAATGIQGGDAEGVAVEKGGDCDRMVAFGYGWLGITLEN